MGTRDIYQRTLVRACAVAGDETALAKRLGVPVERLVGWLLGNSALPVDVFLRALDIVLTRSKQQVRQNHAYLERIRSERRISGRAFALAFIESQSGIIERLSRGAPLETVLALLVLAMESLSDGVLGSVLLLDPDGRIRHAAAPSLPPAYLKAIDGLKIGPAVGSCGTAMYLGRTVVVSDIATDPLWRSYRKHALKHGLRACWSAPILSTGGNVLGAFALYYREPKAPNAQERQLVEVAAQLAAIAIERAAIAAQDTAARAARAMLSPRELQIVRLIAHGEPVKRIAEGLGLTISTVYTHRTRIFQKLGIDSNVRLARYAISHRVVP
jgi:DNA-binding CsgD family transcriptional regulator